MTYRAHSPNQSPLDGIAWTGTGLREDRPGAVRKLRRHRGCGIGLLRRRVRERGQLEREATNPLSQAGGEFPFGDIHCTCGFSELVVVNLLDDPPTATPTP